MKNIYKIIPIVALVIISFSNFSCDKVDLENLKKYDVSFDDVESVMQTEAMLNVAFLDIFNIGIRAGAFADENLSSAKKQVVGSDEIMGGEMSIRYVSGDIGDKTEIPVTVLVDWGDKNKLGADGFSRRGSIVAILKNTNWINGGAEITVSLRDYYFNDYKITGDVTLRNLGDGKIEFKIVDGSITNLKGEVSTRDSDLFLQWKEGVATPKDISDDVWYMYGNVDGKTTNDFEYSISIAENEHLVKSNCKYPTKGIARFVISKVKFSMNYAPVEEACDNIAEVDFYGQKKTIELGEEVN